MTAREYPPGIPAPVAGTYEQRNVFGSSTGARIVVARGEDLPRAPRGFTWRVIDPTTDDGAAF
jgi:hypothetical protein